MTYDRRLTAELETVRRATSQGDVKIGLRIAELDRVTIGREVRGDEGDLIPSGSSGTVVAIWGGGAAYEVEFVQPISALATVEADAISGHFPRV